MEKFKTFSSYFKKPSKIDFYLPFLLKKTIKFKKKL